MRAYVGVGSNLGDRWAHLLQAARGLGSSPRVSVLRGSTVYENAPVGPPQPDYLNAVLELDTRLTAAGLHQLMRLVEEGAGRVRGERWGPRTLDLDLLLFGDEVIDVPGLRVPHPELAGRRFVLAPLAELCPELAVPGAGATVAALLAACPPHEMRAAGPYPLEPASG
jgi:2-amino-4-hydroxy-6-hydroxymethyldihydropteridine diphosphokinase